MADRRGSSQGQFNAKDKAELYGRQQVWAFVLLTFYAETYPMYPRNQQNGFKPMPKPMPVVFVLLTLLFITSHAAGQQAQSAHQHPRGPARYTPPGNNTYQAWVGIDMSHYWQPSEYAVTRFGPFTAWKQHADIAGAWSSEAIPGLVLTLLPDGNFALATPANLDKRCSAGVERGNWTLHEQSGQLLVHIKTDTNGACGFSGVSLTVRKTETGMSLSSHEHATTGDQDVPLVRR